MTWQPIDTAPKDGTPILVIDMTAGNPIAVPVFWAQHDAWGDKPAWLCGTEWPPLSVMTAFQRRAYGEAVGEMVSPTHWHQLPEPPK